MRRTIATVFATSVIAPGATTAAAEGPAVEPEPPGVVAEFEGTRINLAKDWGEATACRSDEESTRCYRTVAEMYDAEGLFANAGALAPRSSCSGDLTLYRNTNYGGGALSLSSRTLHNLASYGFNNDTSSYKIGPCTARFYDTTTGSGLYPGNTNANTSSPTMVAGWDNRVGSVRIT